MCHVQALERPCRFSGDHYISVLGQAPLNGPYSTLSVADQTNECEYFCRITMATERPKRGSGQRNDPPDEF